MNTKSDWQLANRELTAEQRQRLGDPPTAEEIQAYMCGKLAPDEEERVRELLVSYPELARMFAEPFPQEESQPGEPGFVSDEELARRYALLRKRVDGGRVLPFRRYLPTAVAAALALVFAGLYWQAESRARRMEDEIGRPRAVAIAQLRAGAQRGSEGFVTLDKTAADHLLEMPVPNAAHYDAYAVSIAEIGTQKTLQDTAGVLRDDDDIFRITVPNEALGSGRYEVTLFGVTGDVRQTIETFRIRVP